MSEGQCTADCRQKLEVAEVVLTQLEWLDGIWTASTAEEQLSLLAKLVKNTPELKSFERPIQRFRHLRVMVCVCIVVVITT